MTLLRSTWIACRTGAQGVWTFVLWSLWLALALLLAVQVTILASSELAVPDFLLRRLERRIAETGLRATFGRTSFDPTGRVLIENVRLSLPDYPEPTIAVRALYVQLNPWALTVGQFQPREVRIAGATATVPALLSSTGAAQDIVRDLDATLVPAGRQIGITQLSARVAGVVLSARGAVTLPPLDPGRPPALHPGLLATRFPEWCRQAQALQTQLAAFDQPALELELVPGEARGATARATWFARDLKLDTPLAAHVRDLRVTTHLPLLDKIPAVSQVNVTAAELRLPQGTAREVRVLLTGSLPADGFRFQPHEAQVTAGTVEAAGFSARALSARVVPQPLPRLAADVVAEAMGAPLALQAEADFTERSAQVRFAGEISPAVLPALSARLGTDVRRFFSFGFLDCEAGEVRLGPGWKFEKLTARVALRDIDAYRVKMESGRATVELEPGRFRAPEAFARIGDNFAGGSYEQDLRTRQYRFLLDGRLRPLDISGWFREWWPRFFQQFDFTAGAPMASVDVGGFWREGRRSTVFVAADAAQPVIRGAALDRVRTRLFIRPAFVDGLEIAAWQGAGHARGTFTHTGHPQTNARLRTDLDLVSSVDLATVAQIVGPAGEKIFSQFALAQPPEVKLKARFDGEEAPGGAHQALDLQVATRGDFRFHGFPLSDATFAATVRDGDVLVENVRAGYGGGLVTGRAKVWGAGAERRIGFDFALEKASLGQAAAAFQQFTAERKKVPPSPPGKYVQEKANVRLDLAASAEGRFDDAFSYRGNGHAVLEGAEIGEVPLLGQLSELLKFTALRFTSARANFKIEGPKLEFPEVAVRGANSAIDAHGSYFLDRQELDFNAKLFPFQESESIIKSVVGVVLSPISNVFEVKLTGNWAKPEWAFTIGPTNILRSLVPGGSEPAKPSESPATPTPVAEASGNAPPKT